MIQLTNTQLQEVLNHKSTSQEGLNEILTAVLNAIMHAERKAYLTENEESNNKGNGYRPIQVQGYGKLLSLAIPRDRLGLFKPLLMLTLKDEEEEVKNLCFELYKSGLTTRDIAKILEKLYRCRYSQSAVSLMSQHFKEEMEAWRNRPLEKHYPILYLDAIQAKVRRETVAGEAFYIVLAVKGDNTREVLAIENNPVEHAPGWETVLSRLKERGVQEIGLAVADGLPGLEEATLSQFPRAAFQKCVTHFKRNLLNKVRPADKAAIAADLGPIFEVSDNTHSKEKAYAYAASMATRWGKKYPALVPMLSQTNLRTYLTYLDFNFKVRSLIYTTNWVERLNKAFRKALKIRNSMPSIDSVLLLLSAIACDMGKGTYTYPVHCLTNEPTFGQMPLIT